MSVHTRDLYEIAVNVESIRKTAETPASGDWIELLEGVVNEVYTKKENEQRHGTLHHSDSDRLIMQDYNVAIKALIDRVHFPKFVFAILGAQETTEDSPQSGVNTHEFTRADTNLLPLLTITSQDPTDDEVRFSGFGVGKLELSFVKDDFLQYSVEGNGLSKDDPGALSSGYQATNSEFLPWMCEIKVAANVAGLGAASAVELGELTLTLERNNTAYHGIGGNNVEPSEIIAQKLKVSAAVTKLFENLTYKTWAETDNDYRAVQIRLIDTENTIGASTNPSITIVMPKVSARNWVKENADEHTDEKMDLLANLDSTEGDISITIVNAEEVFESALS
jgi:hypothetical protein